MASDRIDILAPDPTRDAEEIIDLFAKVFAGSYFDRRDYCRKRYILNSHYDWNRSRIGRCDGKLVTHWGIWDYTCRVGGCGLRVAGVGAVACHRDYQKRGLITKTLRESLAVLDEAGYDLTTLFGIPDFYHRFGYTRGWEAPSYRVDLGQLPEEKPDARPRKLRPQNADQRVDIYNRQFAGLTGTAVRPTFDDDVMASRAEAYEWLDGEGKVAGWVSHRGEEIVDHGGDAQQVLRVVAQLARKHHWHEVRFSHLHHECEMARLLRGRRCRVEKTYQKSGGPMVKIVNLPAAMGKIAPELTRRLAGSAMAGFSGELALRCGDAACNLQIAKGKVQVGPAGTSRHSVSGGDELAQLVLGTDTPAEVVRAGGLKLTGDAGLLLEALLPAQNPTLSTADCF